MDRLALEWKDMVKFHTKTDQFRIQNDPITMRNWIFERDHYTRIQAITKYFQSRRYIFVVETDVLRIEAENKQEFTVVVSFQEYFFFGA